VNDIVLFAHPTAGVLATLAALWVFVEALNATDSNQARSRWAASATAVFMVMAWLLGGYWYLRWFPAEKALIVAGPWPFAHTVFMETKEHLFFIPLILALYLPIVTVTNLAVNRGARRMALVVAGSIVLNGLAIEGAGAVVNHGAKLAVMPAGSR
jgi:hypothetical protein